jgi:pimeloyl-ACP methyl ester carboxylesterase
VIQEDLRAPDRSSALLASKRGEHGLRERKRHDPTTFRQLRTRHVRRVLSMLVVAVIAVTSVATAGAAAESKSSSSATFAKRVNIGDGRSMYIECRGKGSPTVLLISGTDTASDLWHATDQKGPKVYPTIAKTTRVCAYDRPGAPHLTGELSRSDPVPQPTSPQDGVDDLVALLKAADVPGPYVLAAHSFGGTIARVFAGQHPDEVKGIVFVDVLTPELRAQMTPEEWEIWKRANARPPAAIAEYPALRRDPGPDRGSSSAEAHAGRCAHRQRQVRRRRPEAHRQR